MSVSSGSSLFDKAMKVFDMSTMPKTSLKFIRALCVQSAAAGRAEEIDITREEVEALLGLDHLNSGAPYDLKKPPQEKLL